MKIFKIGLLVIILLALIVSLVIYKNVSSFKKGTYEINLEQCEKITGLRFPASVKLLGSQYTYWMDDVLHFKISVAAEDLDEFIKLSPFKEIKFETNKDTPFHPMNNSKIRWWKASAVKNWKFAQVRLEDTSVLEILIDLDETQPIVYLRWFET